MDRALNILISYNNKPANKAIPIFQDLVIPLSEQLVTLNQNNNSFRNLKSLLKSTRSNFEYVFREISHSQFTPLFVQNEIYPLYMQSVEIADQVIPLLETIGEGKRACTHLFTYLHTYFLTIYMFTYYQYSLLLSYDLNRYPRIFSFTG